MKDKIIFLIIGILIGAILATGGFLIYNKVSTNDSNSSNQGMMGNPQNGGSMPSGDSNMTPPSGTNGDSNSTPPSKPDGDSNSTPPTKPEESTNSTSSTNS